MARKKRNKYLGKTVKDVGKKGLDRAREVEAIARAIKRDYERHKITYRTAIARLNLLILLTYKDKKLDHLSANQKKRLRAYIKKIEYEIMSERGRRK